MCGSFPAGIPHSIQGLEEGCEFLLAFDDGDFSEDQTLLITEWFAHTPREVLAKNFGVPDACFANIPKSQKYIFPFPVPGPLNEVLGQLPEKGLLRLSPGTLRRMSLPAMPAVRPKSSTRVSSRARRSRL